MKRITGLVHCIHCEQIIRATEAVKVFRTGFYQLVYPLARCVRCAQSGAKRLNSEKVS